MDYKLEEVSPRTSCILDFLGLHFNLEQAIVSPPDSFLDSLTSVLYPLSASTVMPACQLADPSSLRTVVTSRVLTAHQLAGTGSDKISHSSVGTSVAQSDYLHILRQQHSSCIHSQTRGTHSISLFNKALELFHLQDQFVILLIPTHLPWARNGTADTLSQMNSPSTTEWGLPMKTLHNLSLSWGPLSRTCSPPWRTRWPQFTFHLTRTTGLGR